MKVMILPDDCLPQTTYLSYPKPIRSPRQCPLVSSSPLNGLIGGGGLCCATLFGSDLNATFSFPSTFQHLTCTQSQKVHIEYAIELSHG
jgi:hypothetical protein